MRLLTQSINKKVKGLIMKENFNKKYDKKEIEKM